jgi:pyruvate/2-oxoglutarate dehydrogenase complex dihydrolipoamide acyltransferase (E2) component
MSKNKEVKQSKQGSYFVIPFTRSRDIVVDFISIGKRTMKVHAIGDIDVTYPLTKIREFKQNGLDISFSAYLTYVFARTVVEHPHMQAIKWGRRKMVVFNDVDVTFLVEREVAGKKMPTQVMIRKANEKTIQEITSDLRGAAVKSDDSMVDKDKEGASATDKLLKMPRFLRRYLFKRIFKNPFLRKRYNGTVGVTSVGVFARGGGTAIGIAASNLSISVGGIEKRPGYNVNEHGEYDTNKIIPRDYLWLTFNIDHTTVDGGPITRFLAIFRDRVRTGYGLSEIKS